MPTFLIDNNLPYYFSLWKTSEFVFQRDLHSRAPDTFIWKFAEENGLTIVTKYRDYSDRMLLVSPPPRVIRFMTGNLRMRAFHALVTENWPHIAELSQTHKLVYVFHDRIEGIE